MLALARALDHRGAAFLGGAALTMAAWTKDEGMVMLLAGAVAFGVALAVEGGLPRLRRLGLPALAAIVPLLLPRLAIRSAAMAPYIATDHWGTSLGPMLEPERWGTILSALAHWADPREQLAPTLLLAAVAVAGIRGALRGSRFVLAAVLACFAADFAAYLATAWSLPWMLGTSLSRVLLQLWPSLAIGAACAVSERTFAEPAPAAPPGGVCA